MKPSVLTGIIQRLEAMIKSQHEENEVRRFEVDGIEKCQVTYHNDNDTFTLYDSLNKTESQFDNLDLVAIEIYELLN